MSTSQKQLTLNKKKIKHIPSKNKRKQPGGIPKINYPFCKEKGKG